MLYEVITLLLVGSREPVAIDVDTLRARVAREPFRSALLCGWRARDAEGMLARYIGNGGFAAVITSYSIHYTKLYESRNPASRCSVLVDPAMTRSRMMLPLP